MVIDGRVYCRRHAGVVSALPGGYLANAAPLPDLENRAPSLVSWVAREVDADIRHLLLSVPDPGEVTELLTDPVYLVFTGADRRRAWERAWKLVDQTGDTLRVSLLVEEWADAEVAVRVDMAIVERLMPPWIAQRLHGALPPPEDSTRSGARTSIAVSSPPSRRASTARRGGVARRALRRSAVTATSLRLMSRRRRCSHYPDGSLPNPGHKASPVSQRRILVVDDDPRLLHIVAMYLGIEGSEVATASNGEEGLQEVDARKPDL